MTVGPGRRMVAELIGTGLLTCAVIGSGIAATGYSPGEPGLQLLENTLATAATLAVLIVVLGPISGAHFNPAVTLALWWTRGRQVSDLEGRGVVAGYLAAQGAGAVLGAMLANVMFGLDIAGPATTVRSGAGQWLGELVATAGLVFAILALARTGRERLIPAAVAAWIGGAYWFTASTSFANPAVTFGRALTDSFAGIAPGSVPAFVLMQLVGAGVGVGAANLLYRRHTTPILQPGAVSSGGENDVADLSDPERVVPMGERP